MPWEAEARFKAPSHGVISTALPTSKGHFRGAVKVAAGGFEMIQTKAERENARLKEQLKFQVC